MLRAIIRVVLAVANAFAREPRCTGVLYRYGKLREDSVRPYRCTLKRGHEGPCQ
jgi:hypothetical protein